MSIHFRSVTKRYETAANELSLGPFDAKIEKGSFVSLVGPSGCGKSTALKLAAGLLTPSEGSVILEAEARRSFVFQDATLMPWASVYDNVYLPFQLERVERSEADPKIREALERVGLADRADAFPRELSGGMKMRVSIARALVTEPDVLLMDEPFAALDEFTREKLDDDLLSLWQAQGWTALFVTHSVYESVYLSERVLVMSDGPGQLVDDVAIPAPFPRDARFRESADYFDACRRVSASLRPQEKGDRHG